MASINWLLDYKCKEKKNAGSICLKDCSYKKNIDLSSLIVTFKWGRQDKLHQPLKMYKVPQSITVQQFVHWNCYFETVVHHFLIHLKSNLSPAKRRLAALRRDLNHSSSQCASLNCLTRGAFLVVVRTRFPDKMIQKLTKPLVLHRGTAETVQAQSNTTLPKMPRSDGIFTSVAMDGFPFCVPTAIE